jgi:hypothetical protein
LEAGFVFAGRCGWDVTGTGTVSVVESRELLWFESEPESLPLRRVSMGSESGIGG